MKLQHIFLLLVCLLVAGCGQPAAPETAGQPTAPAIQPAAGKAVVTGIVRWQGPAPVRRPVVMTGSVECVRLHAEAPLDETVIVNENGTLRNVVVRIQENLRGQQWPAPSEPAVFDQRGCMFVPHVLAVQVGQPVVIRNNDPCTHNVHTLSELNQPLNFNQPQQGQEDVRTFDQNEIVRVKCDIHSWMIGYIHVVPHPFFSVTGTDGTFQLVDVPPGQYTIQAWHERYGTKAHQVQLEANERLELTFTFPD